MGYLVTFDQSTLQFYHANYSVNPVYNYTLSSLRVFQDYFDPSSIALAQGATEKLHYPNTNMTKTLFGHKLKDEFLPIPCKITFTSNSQCSVFSVLNAVQRKKKPTLLENPYPLAIRYVDKNGYYYIERPPFQMEVDLREKGKTKVTHGAKVWIPWSLVAFNPINPSASRVYFSHKPLSGMDDKYIPSTLPNTYQDGSICFGQSLNRQELWDLTGDKSDNIRQLYSLVFNEYMTGGWNTDLYPNMVGSISKEYKTGGMIDKYLSVSPETLRNHYPKMTKNAAEKVYYGKHGLRLDQFKYMFYSLGTMSLEETLGLYEEILDQKENSRITSFEKILAHENPITTGYAYFANRIANSCDQQYGNYHTIEFTVLLENYRNVKNQDGSACLTPKTLGSLTDVAKLIFENYSNLILEFFHKEKNKDFSNGSSVYIVDAETGKYTETSMLISYDQFYFNYLRDHYSVPYTTVKEVFS